MTVVQIFFSVAQTSGGTQAILGAGLGLNSILGWDSTEDQIPPGSIGTDPSEAGNVVSQLTVYDPATYTFLTETPSTTNSPANQLQNLDSQSGITFFASPQQTAQYHAVVIVSGGDAGFNNSAEVTQISEVIDLVTNQTIAEPHDFLLSGSGLLIVTALLLVRKRRPLSTP